MVRKVLMFLIIFVFLVMQCIAENISQEQGKIYIVTNLTYQDAISVSGIMDESDVMLITDPNFLPNETENFLNNITNREIIIVGGNFVIKDNVRKKIKDIARLRNCKVREIYGKEAEDTTKEIIKFKNKKINALVIVNKNSIDDCFSSSSLASLLNFSIAYTEKDTLPNSTKEIIEKYKVKEIIIVGGKGIVSEGVENFLRKYNTKITRLWGITAKDTNEKVYEFLKEKIHIQEIYRIKEGGNVSNLNLLNLQFKKFFEINKEDKKGKEIKIEEIYKKINEKLIIKAKTKAVINTTINIINTTSNNTTINQKLNEKIKEKIVVPKDPITHIMKDEEILKYAKNDVVVFKFLYNPGCPHCEYGMQYLNKLKKKFGDRIVIEKTQIYDSENWRTFSQECISRGLRAFPFTISIGKRAIINGNISYDASFYWDGFNGDYDYNAWISNICAQFENKPDECM